MSAAHASVLPDSRTLAAADFEALLHSDRRLTL